MVKKNDWKQRRRLMSLVALVFLPMAGVYLQQITDGASGILIWIGLIGAVVAGVAAVLAVNQFANREVAEAREGKMTSEAGQG